MKLLATALLSLLLLGGCGEVAHVFGLGACSEAFVNLREDPQKAAERAMSHGDRRFVAVNSYTTWTPSVENLVLEEEHGIRVLEKTGDNPEDASCVHYQDAATRYADQYNQRVLELSRSHEPPRRVR